MLRYEAATHCYLGRRVQVSEAAFLNARDALVADGFDPWDASLVLREERWWSPTVDGVTPRLVVSAVLAEAAVLLQQVHRR